MLSEMRCQWSDSLLMLPLELCENTEFAMVGESQFLDGWHVSMMSIGRWV